MEMINGCQNKNECKIVNEKPERGKTDRHGQNRRRLKPQDTPIKSELEMCQRR